MKNEVYVGDIKFQKSPSVDVITGIPDKEQIDKYIENHHEGIVNRNLWNKVRDILENNRNRFSMSETYQKSILMLLRESEAMTAMQISEKTGIDIKTVKYQIRSLKEKGQLIRSGSARCGKWIVID